MSEEVTDCLPPSRDVVVSVSKMQQSCQRIIQASMETDDQHKVRVGIKINLTIRCVLHLHTKTDIYDLTWKHETIS